MDVEKVHQVGTPHTLEFLFMFCRKWYVVRMPTNPIPNPNACPLIIIDTVLILWNSSGWVSDYQLVFIGTHCSYRFVNTNNPTLIAFEISYKLWAVARERIQAVYRDSRLFAAILHNPHHMLHSLLPPVFVSPHCQNRESARQCHMTWMVILLISTITAYVM